jgi:hypothetical protein
VKKLVNGSRRRKSRKVSKAPPVLTTQTGAAASVDVSAAPSPNDSAKGSKWIKKLASRGILLWTLFSGAAVLLAFYLDIGGLRDRLRHRRVPNVEVKFYDRVGDKLALADKGPIVRLDEKSFRQKEIEVPLFLAFRNREEEPLEIVKLDLEYPHGLTLRSEGRAKIDPEGDRLIYEHDLGVIEPSTSFTAVKEIDRIVLPMAFVATSVVALLNDDVPMYVHSLVGVPYGSLQQKEIPIAVTLYCKERPPLHILFALSLDAAVAVNVDIPDGRSEGIADEDRKLIEQLRTRPERVLVDWNQEYNKGEAFIHYKKVAYKKGIFELVFVNDELRRVIADLRGNGLENFELILGKNSPPRKLVPSSPTPLESWSEEDVK